MECYCLLGVGSGGVQQKAVTIKSEQEVGVFFAGGGNNGTVLFPD